MTTRIDVDRSGLLAPTDPARTRGWAALGAAIVVALVHLAPATGLAPGALDADLGIQFFLGGETARGAVPLIDFEHTWNVASWWFNAALFRLAGGDPSVWLYLWGRVFGPALAGVTAIGVLHRLRLRPEWILIGAGAWLALSHVVHSKYTIPVVWVLALVSWGWQGRTRAAVACRLLLAGLTVLSQVEMAVLLGAGVMLFDLIGPGWGGRDLRQRVLRAAAVPVGVLLALGLELAVYAAVGQPPAEVLRQLLFNAAETAPGFTYGYPLFSAPSLRPKLFPASLLLAFVPVVWLRLGPAARLVACLHLAQALIAIRRPDPAHVDAATTLLGLLVVLVLHDLWAARRPSADHPAAASVGTIASPDRSDGPHEAVGHPAAASVGTIASPDRSDGPHTSGQAVLGALAFAAATAAAFRTESLVALAAPTAILAATALLTDRRPRLAVGTSIGALAVTALLLTGSVAGGVRASLAADQALTSIDALAEELAGPLDRCTDARRRAWIVPGPLPLYTAMDIDNPTPYTVFWYGFAAEHDRVRDAIDDGMIPAIIQVGEGWPDSFGTLPDAIEAAFRSCATVPTTSIGQPVTIWTTTTAD